MAEGLEAPPFCRKPGKFHRSEKWSLASPEGFSDLDANFKKPLIPCVGYLEGDTELERGLLFRVSRPVRDEKWFPGGVKEDQPEVCL